MSVSDTLLTESMDFKQHFPLNWTLHLHVSALSCSTAFFTKYDFISLLLLLYIDNKKGDNNLIIESNYIFFG